ncbi:MAG: hypothetical protein JXQ93_02220 [Flavobacteriaceae bacterium]
MKTNKIVNQNNKNIEILLEMKHYILTILILISAMPLMAQDADSNDAKDNYTDNASWSWTIDDNDNQNGSYFRWWNNGVDNSSQLLMELNADSRKFSLFAHNGAKTLTFIPSKSENIISSLYPGIDYVPLSFEGKSITFSPSLWGYNIRK